MPGGFHPFHAGHMALYNSARQAFPNADLYVAATNSQEERPFPFAVKEKLAKVAGVESGHFIQVKSPFQAKEITQHYNPEEDVLIFVRSEKDKNESPKPGGMKKDGTPAYFQPYTGKDMQPFGQHAYFAYLPTVKFGPGITSATEIRKAWPTLNDKRKTAMVMSLYPASQKNPKLAANIVAMLDQVMGGQVAEAIDDKHRLSKGKPTSDEVRRKYFDKAMASVLGGQGTDSEKNKAASRYFKIKQITDPVAEDSLNEFAVDGFGDSSDKRSKLLASVGRLLDTGNKVDWQVPGQMGHVTRVQDDGITMKRWKMPHSKMSFFLPMNDDSRDSKYTIKMVAPKHYAVVSAEQSVTEGADGWIGNPAKWKEAVLQAHGPDVVFKNYSHPGQPGKRSVHAWDANNKIVGVYQRHNKMGMVQPNMQGVDEGFSDVVKGIKRKVAGKEDPKEVEHTYGRIARSAIKHKTPDQAEKDIKRWEKVNKVVNKEDVAEGEEQGIDNKYRRAARKMIQVYKTNPEVKAEVDASPEFYRAMVYVTGVITNPEKIDGTTHYHKIVDELESIFSYGGEQGVAEDQGFGTDYPGTYEQDTEPFLKNAGHRTRTLTSEGNLSESADYLEEK